MTTKTKNRTPKANGTRNGPTKKHGIVAKNARAARRLAKKKGGPITIELTKSEKLELTKLSEKREAIKTELANHTLNGTQIASQWNLINGAFNDRIAVFAEMYDIKIEEGKQLNFDHKTLTFSIVKAPPPEPEEGAAPKPAKKKSLSKKALLALLAAAEDEEEDEFEEEDPEEEEEGEDEVEEEDLEDADEEEDDEDLEEDESHLEVVPNETKEVAEEATN